MLQILGADDLLRIEPEELSGVLLEIFNANPEGGPGSMWAFIQFQFDELKA